MEMTKQTKRELANDCAAYWVAKFGGYKLDGRTLKAKRLKKKLLTIKTSVIQENGWLRYKDYDILNIRYFDGRNLFNN